MNYSKKERERYNQNREITCKRLNITKNEYNWFRRKGLYLQDVYVHNCNGSYATEMEYESNAHGKEAEIEKKAKELKLFVYLQTDPRGATVYLDTKAIPDNNYNQANCIY
jgi:hypothetical protein